MFSNTSRISVCGEVSKAQSRSKALWMGQWAASEKNAIQASSLSKEVCALEERLTFAL